MKSARGRIVKAAGLLLALRVVEKTTGLLKQIWIAAAFGTSAVMDGYVAATSIIGLILSWVGLPVQQTLIPLFRHDLAQRGERAAWANISVLFNTLLMVLAVIVVLGEVFAPELVGLLAPGFDEQTKSLASSLVRITAISVVFVGMGKVLAQLSFSYEKFFRPGIVGSVNNLVVLALLFGVGANYGIHGLAVATVIGAACEFVLLLPILWQKRKFYSYNVNLRNREVAEMGKLSVPLLLSTGGFELSRITDRIFASLLPAGRLSALAFAHRPITILLEFLIQPLQQASFPHFTKLCARRDFRTLSPQLFRYLRVVFFITLPVAIGIMLTAGPIVQLVYQRGAFDETAVSLTSQALFFYAVGFPAYAMARIFRGVFFGMKDAWTPTKISLGCIGIKIFLAWILVEPLAHRGIALADSVSQIINVLILFYFLPEEIRGQEGWRTVTAFAQTIAACLVIGAVVYFTKESIYGLFGPLIAIVSLILLGGAVYAAIALLLRMEASQSVLKALTELGGKYLRGASKAA